MLHGSLERALIAGWCIWLKLTKSSVSGNAANTPIGERARMPILA